MLVTVAAAKQKAKAISKREPREPSAKSKTKSKQDDMPPATPKAKSKGQKRCASDASEGCNSPTLYDLMNRMKKAAIQVDSDSISSSVAVVSDSSRTNASTPFAHTPRSGKSRARELQPGHPGTARRRAGFASMLMRQRLCVPAQC